jgi:hypothetical protein
MVDIRRNQLCSFRYLNLASTNLAQFVRSFDRTCRQAGEANVCVVFPNSMFVSNSKKDPVVAFETKCGRFKTTMSYGGSWPC